MELIIMLYIAQLSDSKDSIYNVALKAKEENAEVKIYYEVFSYRDKKIYPISIDDISHEALRAKISSVVENLNNLEDLDKITEILRVTSYYPIFSSLNIFSDCYKNILNDKIKLGDDEFCEDMCILDYNAIVKKLNTIRYIRIIDDFIEDKIIDIATEKCNNILPREIFTFLKDKNKKYKHLWIKSNELYDGPKYIARIEDINDLKFDNYKVKDLDVYILPISEHILSTYGYNIFNCGYTYFNYVTNSTKDMRKFLLIVDKKNKSKKSINKCIKAIDKGLYKKYLFVDKNICYEDSNIIMYIIKKL